MILRPCIQNPIISNHIYACKYIIVFSGQVTIGGSICMDFLTTSGWRSSNPTIQLSSVYAIVSIDLIPTLFHLSPNIFIYASM